MQIMRSAQVLDKLRFGAIALITIAQISIALITIAQISIAWMFIAQMVIAPRVLTQIKEENIFRENGEISFSCDLVVTRRKVFLI